MEHEMETGVIRGLYREPSIILSIHGKMLFGLLCPWQPGARYSSTSWRQEMIAMSKCSTRRPAMQGTRVCSVAKGERSYHVFFQMLQAGFLNTLAATN